MTKVCPQCKTENPDDSDFCKNCGNNLKGVTAAQKSPKSGPTGWWGKQSNLVKALSIIGVCCLGLIIIVGISAILSPDSNTSTTTSTPTTTTTSTPSTTTTTPTTTSATGIQISVSYSGSWTGSYGDESGQQSVEGSGSKTFTMSGDPSVVSAVFQKDDGGSGTLTVEILEDGVPVESKSTSAQYGVVSVAHSFF